MSVLMEHAPATVELALAGVVFALMLALPLGVISGLRPWSAWDQGSAVLALIGVAIPNFFLGPVLLHWFAVRWDVFPDPGEPLAGLSTLALPAIVLGTALAAKLTRMVRASVLDEVHSPHVLAARARGLRPSRILIQYVLRGAMIPVVTILGLQFASLLTGTIVLEKVFARPGLGSLLLDGVASRNHALVQGVVLLFSFAYVGVNGVVDLVHVWLDPRVRMGGRFA
jgi:peptide/nickel transport system permease protein